MLISVRNVGDQQGCQRGVRLRIKDRTEREEEVDFIKAYNAPKSVERWGTKMYLTRFIS
jgi:hypothetical protein